MDQKHILEAALFVTQKPLDLHTLAKITSIGSLGFLKEMIESLQKEYSERGMEITETTDGWQMQVRSEILPAVASLTPHQDMAEGPKRCLALILYKEPVKQSDIIKTQGTKAYAYIKDLKKMGLVKKEKQGHTSILTVTKELENYFGQSKERIREQLATVPEPSSTVNKNPSEE